MPARTGRIEERQERDKLAANEHTVQGANVQVAVLFSCISRSVLLSERHTIKPVLSRKLKQSAAGAQVKVHPAVQVRNEYTVFRTLAVGLA